MQGREVSMRLTGARMNKELHLLWVDFVWGGKESAESGNCGCIRGSWIIWI
jgi:hypothetical protein